ncbi:hypothetical protein BGW41_008224 [Actinomortierella wolfii]|nr:hypothetical protein BGW41_008224 [Actinomortierella wolfii]
MTVESNNTTQQHQQETEGAVADLAATKPTYFPGTRDLKQKKDKAMQSTTSLSTTNTDHFQNYDPVVSSGRKGWKHSLKKATSSVLYMAMPPSHAEQMPMVVPETPMSPDKLPSTPLVLRTPIKGPPSLAHSTSSASSRSGKSTLSTDQQSAGPSVSQMPPMPALDISSLQRAHTMGSAFPRDQTHVKGGQSSKEKERKSTSDQPLNTASLVDKASAGRRTKSFSAASSSHTASSSRASSSIPPVPVMTPLQIAPMGGQPQGSGSRNNRNSMDYKASAASTHIAAPSIPPPQQTQSPLPHQDSSDDDLELPSLPLPPSYTQGRGNDRVVSAPLPIVASVLASSPPDEPPLPVLPLPPTSSNSTIVSTPDGQSLSRSNTTSTIHSTSTINTTIMTATRVTTTPATEIPIPPAQKPTRPKLGAPRRSSPVIIKPLVLDESGDEKAFEDLLRTVIIPNNRPAGLTDPLLNRTSLTAVNPSAADHMFALATQESGVASHVDDGENSVAYDEDYPIAESVAGEIENIEAEDEQAVCHTETSPIVTDQEPLSVDDSAEESSKEVTKQEDNQEETVVVTEDQVIELQVQESATATLVSTESDMADMPQVSVVSKELMAEEKSTMDTQDMALDAEKAEPAEDSKEQEVVPPAKTRAPDTKHKEIVIFGEDLFVEIAAPIWSGSEDEMEPKSPTVDSPTSPAIGAQSSSLLEVPPVAISEESQVSSGQQVDEVVSEPAAVLESPVVVPATPSFTGVGDQKLTLLPPGTKGAISLPIALPNLAAAANPTLPPPPPPISSSSTISNVDMAVASPTKVSFEPSPLSTPRSSTLSTALSRTTSISGQSATATPSKTMRSSATVVVSRRERRRLQRQAERLERQKRAAFQRQLIAARKARASPWVWNQEGYRHHRLESHQILTREQVAERFHLELDGEGPNGFFLFKLIRRFTDPVQKGAGALPAKRPGSKASSSGSGKESSASTSSSSTRNKGEPSLESFSFAQRLKRQLWIQKSKKEKKSSSSSYSASSQSAADEGEVDLKEMLMTNNASMSDLNSSLQEVIDAVDSLKRNPHLWVDDDSMLSADQDGSSAEEKVVYPQSDDEFAIRDKDHLVEHVAGLERRKGIYSTGRLDGMDLMPKKRFRSMQRRASHRASSASTLDSSKASHGSSGSDLNSTSLATTTSAAPQFKKQAVMQLHIYSRNGLKFKFDVMDNDELHFVEASKKYTFMDPLPANRQPTLPSTLTKVQEEEHESSNLLQDEDNGLARSLSTQRGIHPMYMTDRQLRSSMHITPGSSSGSAFGTAGSITSSSKSKRLSISSTLTTGSSTAVPPGKRVYVTRLGRHTLLTYQEYKDLAKSPGFLTLGAKLLIQRNISSLKGSSSSSSSPSSPATAISSPPLSGSAMEGSPLSLASSYGATANTAAMATSPTSPLGGVAASQNTPLSPPPSSATPSSSSSATATAESTDYFSVKKKPIGLPGFGSKSKSSSKSSSSKSSLTAALNAAASGGPSTPSTPGSATGGEKTSRAIVTPYNPNDYKTPVTPQSPSNVSSMIPTAASTDGDGSLLSSSLMTFSPGSNVNTTTNSTISTPIHIPAKQPSSSLLATPISPSSPTPLGSVAIPNSTDASGSATTTTHTGNTTGGAVPININKKGNQAGLKFHHLFAMVHQRLCKLELEGGVPLLGVGLVQWAPIVDPAELRWWRDTVGISMIGWIEGDDVEEVEEGEEDDEEDDDDDTDEYDSDEEERPQFDENGVPLVIHGRSDNYDEDDEDDDDEEFFDIESHFDDESEDQILSGQENVPTELFEEDDGRDEDEDIYDRSLGRSPPQRPTSILTMAMADKARRPLSTATTATFQTAHSRIRRVASPTRGGSGESNNGQTATMIPGATTHRRRHPRRRIQGVKGTQLLSSSSGSSTASHSSPQEKQQKDTTTKQKRGSRSTRSLQPRPPARQRSKQVTVERLGYRFVRVSGHLGVLKVTVSEKVEARAVALAIQAQAHVQQYHPLEPQCHLAGCKVLYEQQQSLLSDGANSLQSTNGGGETAFKGPWEEGVEAIGLAPGETLIERMSMISAQARAFNGNYYMKTIKMFNKARR